MSQAPSIVYSLGPSLKIGSHIFYNIRRRYYSYFVRDETIQHPRNLSRLREGLGVLL